MKQFFFLIILYTTIFATDNSYEKGRILYIDKACSNCHGTNAEGSNIYPKLANRLKNLLTQKLQQFQEGKFDTQTQEIMFGFVKSLTKQDIDDLSTYLANYQKESEKKYKLDASLLGSVD